MTKTGLLGTTACVVAAIATACSGSSSTQQNSTTAGASSAIAGPASPTDAVAAITITNMKFSAPVTVRPGVAIAITNEDFEEHSVTSDTPGVFDVEVEANMKGMLTAPSAPGGYPFHCKYHPVITGVLTVK
jgi:plastocyanin